MQEPPDATVARVAAEQQTTVSTAQLLDAGLSHDGILRRVRAGRLHPMYRGTYCVGHAPVSDEAWIQAGVLATDGLAAHRTAACLWGFCKRQERDPVEVVTTRSLHDRPPRDGRPALRVHQATELDPRWTRRHGIKVTSAERTLLDCAASQPYRDARRLVGQALVTKRASIHSLLNTLERHPGHPGQKALRQIILTAEPTRSEAEDLLNELLKSNHLHAFEANQHVPGVGELDFFNEKLNLALEFDGREFHDNSIARADDRAKQRRADASGITIIRLRWPDVTTDRRRTIRRIRHASAGEPGLEPGIRGPKPRVLASYTTPQ